MKKPILEKSSKSLIYLKSLVASLGVILIISMMALVLVKFNRSKTLSEAEKCDNNLIINIDNEIEKIELQGGNIVVLTKFNKEFQRQEIIKFDSNCGKIISKTTFQKYDENNRN